MATITKLVLSGSPGSGRNVLVAATATPGTLIHTAHATDEDELWLWANNTDATDRKLTLEWGGTTAPNDLVEMTIPAEDGPHLIVPGWVISGGLVVRGFAAAASLVTIAGYVNRITP